MHNRSFPPGTVVPELAYPDVGQAIAWLCRAFGFRERLRIADHRSSRSAGLDRRHWPREVAHRG